MQVRLCTDQRSSRVTVVVIFFLMDAATTDIYTLSLHDALPISPAAGLRPRVLPVPAWRVGAGPRPVRTGGGIVPRARGPERDRKSTRLNSSHSQISYAVFCLKKKIH